MIPKFTNGDETATRLNSIIDAIEALGNMTGDEFINVNHTTGGVSISFNKLPFAGGGSAGLRYVEIVEMPSYPDLEADETTEPEEYSGRSWYTARLLASEYEAWSGVTQYLTGDNATVDDILYVALRDNINMPPASSPDDWEKAEEIRVQYVYGYDSDNSKDIRDFVPWFEKGETVPVLTRTVDEETRYYLYGNTMYGGTKTQSTMRYDTQSKITQAVFR